MAFLSTLTQSRSNAMLSSASVHECALWRAHLCRGGEELEKVDGSSRKPKKAEVQVGDVVDDASFDLVFNRRGQVIIVLVDLFVLTKRNGSP